MKPHIGDRVRYYADEEPGTVTAVWFEKNVGWYAEIDHTFTCLVEDLLPVVEP